MQSALERCAVCGTDAFRPWFHTDFGAIGRCTGCGQVLRTDRPDRDAHVDLHRTTEIHESPYATRGEEAVTELRIYDRLFHWLDQSASGGRILDVGCSNGVFLSNARERGFRLAGLEPVKEFHPQLEELDLEVLETMPFELADFGAERFDAISMWDVLEHLVDPRGALEKARELLKPGGLIGLATINHRCLLYLAYHAMRYTLPPLARRFGPLLYNPYHTYYFNKRRLARLLAETGFEIVEHRGYEFPLGRLQVPGWVKLGMRALYLVQGVFGWEGEQYVLARRT